MHSLVVVLLGGGDWREGQVVPFVLRSREWRREVVDGAGSKLDNDGKRVESDAKHLCITCCRMSLERQFEVEEVG